LYASINASADADAPLVRLHRGAEALYIHSRTLHNRQHLGFIALHRIEAGLVDLAADLFSVVLCRIL
jgi:hypothetical protein